MLTESEKQWLHNRKLSLNPYCGWCMRYALCCNPHYQMCPTQNTDLQDAAEFSERVAAKLAEYAAQKIGIRVSRPERLLKAARLQVEEEMDADMD